MRKTRIAVSLLLSGIALSLPAHAETSAAGLSESLPPAKNLVSVEVASLANAGFDGTTRYGGIGVRYGRELVGSLFISGDAITAEAGVFYYNVINYGVVGDDYAVMPVNAVVQYGKVFEESFRPYLYAGGMKNFSFVARSPRTPGDGLSTFQPAVGVGFSVMFKGLIARADFGTDVIGAGLAYAF